MMPTTGPNVSSCMSAIPWEQSSMTVGAMKRPCGSPSRSGFPPKLI